MNIYYWTTSIAPSCKSGFYSEVTLIGSSYIKTVEVPKTPSICSSELSPPFSMLEKLSSPSFSLSEDS
jgi:hypothetical protein